jgi:hypothetical protein
MLTKKYYKKISILIIFFFISSFYLFLLNFDILNKFFLFFSLPISGFPFGDLANFSDFVKKYKIIGTGAFIEKDFWNRPFIYPKIFYYFSYFINLDNYKIFLLTGFFFISLYIYAVINIIKFCKKSCIILLLFSLSSSSSMYLIERGNWDLILFFFVYLSFNISNIYYKYLITTLLCFLKINFLNLFIVISNSKKTLLISLSMIMLIVISNFIYAKSYYLNEDIGYSATIISYGLPTIIKSILKNFGLYNPEFLNTYNFIINFSFSLLFLILILFYIRKIIFNFINKNFEIKYTNDERLFLIGSSYYVLSFLLFSAPDYKLVFLIFTFPYLSNNKNNFNILLLILIFVIMNSCLFNVNKPFQTTHQLIDKYNALYFYKGFLIHLIKIAVFIFLIRNIKIILHKKLNIKWY